MVLKRKAFTLIELLLVIGVLIILIGIVVWGLKGAGGTVGMNATRTTLQNLTNMSEELNRKNKMEGLEQIYPPAPPLPPTAVGFETAPGNVTSDTKNQDRLGPATYRTAQLVKYMTSIPDNKKILERFPSDQLLPVPPSGAFTGGTVVLDGWRNPILFVPPAGLANVRSAQPGQNTFSSGSNYSRGARVILSGDYWTAVDSTSSSPSPPSWFHGVRSPDGRAFWASAGPDGNFATGDDNVYSFEQ
jgi:type II secretory pathway pseudopilin PulG